MTSRVLPVLSCLALLFAGCTSADRPDGVATGDFQVQVAPETLRSDEVTLVWERDAVVGRAARYEIVCDGRPLGQTPKNHFTARLEPRHRYTFTIREQTPNGAVRVSNSLPVETRAREAVVLVTDYGAKGDGHTLNTKAIQAAIAACPKDGVVRIPAGVFVSGALFLKSHMTLQIEAGGVLQGSTSAADYEPFLLNRFEGWELMTYASLLNAGTLDHSGPANVHHLSIRGAGTLRGGGAPLAKAMIEAHGIRSRGRLLCLMNCEGLEIQGLTLEESPCWTLHYLYSQDVSCHDLTIRSRVRNGDGIDPDSSRNSYIFHCTFDTGDDCIAVKSGKNPEGNIVNRPTEKVWVFDCDFRVGHGISLGSETSGGIRDVLVEDCTAGALLNGMQIKSTKDRGAFIEHVSVRDCDLEKITVLTRLNYNNDGQPAPQPPFFRDFRFSNLDLRHAKPGTPVIMVNGFDAPGHRTTDVSFEHVTLPAGAVVQVDQAERVTFSDVMTVDGRPPKYEVTRSEGVKTGPVNFGGRL